ncbi:MAG TPA: hypothetical protein VMF66_02735 [Candidatus Acidoferrum sp.]|nr:hypothetical protein [Candidatus Acidoferrum sp.]
MPARRARQQSEQPEVDFDQAMPQRRRSERVSKSLPIVVRGTDLLGQPFEERTATLNFNLHGCRYASRYHLPKNAWVTLEVPRGSEFENTRARVAWIQRPHSVREFFQISVELEAPQNIWRFEPSPEDWAAVERTSIAIDLSSETASESETAEIPELRVPEQIAEPREQDMDEMERTSAASESDLERGETDENREHELSSPIDAGERPNDATTYAEHAAPDHTTRIAGSHNAWMSADVFDSWKREFEQLQEAARDRLAGYETELLSEIKAEFRQNLDQAKWLIGEIEKSREALHAENEAASESVNRLAHERAVSGEARQSQRGDSFGTEFSSTGAAAEWRERISSEMDVARGQWNELLQSSLDSGVQRLAERLSERAGEVLQPLVDTVNGAQEKATGIQRNLEDELTRAKASLAEIEHSAAKVSNLSGQIDSVTSTAVDELNRRLELILNAQTEEMGERAERLTGRAAAKAVSELDAASKTTIEDVAAQIETRLNPHYDRVSGLLRELTTKELQAEESLRLQRERLRQVSEASQREFLSAFDHVVAAARNDFEAARQDAAARWNEEIESNKALASRSVSEAAEAASRIIEDRSRARVEAAAEEVLAATSLAFEKEAGSAKQKFSNEMERASADRVERIREQLDGLAADLTSRSRTEIERAAEAAAGAFGQVLRAISDGQIESFNSGALGVVETQKEALESSARRLLRNFETNAESSLARFHQQMAAQVETSIAEGRSALSSEFKGSLEAFRAERDAHERDWAETLDRLNTEAAARYQDRINTTSDTWVVSSVRRLNEHGQNLVESLMRSADDAVRESCAKLFDGLAEILRERSSLSGRAANSTSPRDMAAAVPPPDSALDQTDR